MAEWYRLLLLAIVLAVGLTAITLAALRAQASVALLRVILAAICLFNLLVLGGLALWYLRIHVGAGGSGPVTAVVSVLALVKIAWVFAFAATVRVLLGDDPGGRFAKRFAAAGTALVAIYGVLLVAGRISGRGELFGLAVGLVELSILLGALGFAVYLLLRAGMRRKSLVIFAGFHIALFALMTAGLVSGWLRPDGSGRLAPIGGSLLMLAYNVFPVVWVRRFVPSGPTDSEATFSRYRITPREREVIRLVCTGRKNQEIADRLFISVATVKDHTHNIFRKTGVRNRVELVNLFGSSFSQEAGERITKKA